MSPRATHVSPVVSTKVCNVVPVTGAGRTGSPVGPVGPIGPVTPAVPAAALGPWTRAAPGGPVSALHLAAEHPEHCAPGADVPRKEREQLRNAAAGAGENGAHRAVADAGRRTPRAGGAQRLHVGEREGLSGEPTRGRSLHTPSDDRGTGSWRIPTLYGGPYRLAVRRARKTTLFCADSTCADGTCAHGEILKALVLGLLGVARHRGRLVASPARHRCASLRVTQVGPHDGDRRSCPNPFPPVRAMPQAG